MSVKGGADLADKRFVNLVATYADAGADARQQVGWIAAKFLAHGRNHRPRHVFDCTLPT